MKTKSKKILWAAVSLLIVALLACSVLLVQYINKPTQVPEASAPAVDENGNELDGDTVHKMPKAMLFTRAAEEGVTVNATVKPETATNKQVDWAVSFVNPESEWATGKTVTDYVTVTPTADGSTTATVKCLGEFGEQIKVTATSRENELASASMTVDYKKRITNTIVKFDGRISSASDFILDYSSSSVLSVEASNTGTRPEYTYENWGLYDNSVEFEYGVGTVEGDELDLVCKYEYSASFRSALTSQGFTLSSSATSSTKEIEAVTYRDIILSVLSADSQLVDQVHGIKPSNPSVPGITTEKWNKYVAALQANTDDYDFKFIISERSGGNAKEFKVKLSTPEITAESIELDNSNIVF